MLRPRLQVSTLAAALASLVAAGSAAAGDTPAKIVARAPKEAFQAAMAGHQELRAQEGLASARCKVSAAGAVSDCVLVRAYPANSPFGQVVLAVAPKFQVAPATHEGKPVEGDILIDVGDFHYDKPAGWLRKPTANDLLSVWPKAALRNGVSGDVILNCLVNVDGALFECLAQDETPPGMDFGAAGLALTPQFLMKPAELAGRPVISEARIPINFRTYGPVQAGLGERKTANAAMVWAQAPTYADVAAAYPEKAREKRLGGRAILYCSFTKEGRLHGCDTVAEEPHGYGFAAAAHKLAGSFRAYPPAEANGFSNAAVQLPVTFDPAMLDGSNQVIGKPDWAGLPDADEVHAAFGAMPRNIGTLRVVLGCVVQQGGWMGDCKVASEAPAGKGLGAAALALAGKFRVISWTNEGLPVVGARIDVPIRYESGAPTPDEVPAMRPNTAPAVRPVPPG